MECLPLLTYNEYSKWLFFGLVTRDWHSAIPLMNSHFFGCVPRSLSGSTLHISANNYGSTYGTSGTAALCFPTSAVRVERYLVAGGLATFCIWRFPFFAPHPPHSPGQITNGTGHPLRVTRVRRVFQAHGDSRSGLHDARPPAPVTVEFLVLLSGQHHRIINVCAAHHE